MIVERSIAICVFRNGPRILAAPGYDDVAEERFYRPLGGEIEPGESAEEALSREILEETGLQIESLRRLGELDNRFNYRGQPHRETVVVFDAAFKDRSVYERATVDIQEAVWEGPAQWIDLRALPEEPVYPEGLLKMLLEEP